MHTSTRKLDRVKADSRSNCGWSTDSLVTGPGKHTGKQTRRLFYASTRRLEGSRAGSGSNCGWPTDCLAHWARLTRRKQSRHFMHASTKKLDRLKAFSRADHGRTADCPLVRPERIANLTHGSPRYIKPKQARTFATKLLLGFKACSKYNYGRFIVGCVTRFNTHVESRT